MQNASQDHFTVFSPLYAHAIQILGLRNAEVSLTVVFKLCGLIGVGLLARSLSNPQNTSYIVAAFIILPTGYGAYQAFRYSEDWLTARTLAEASIILAIALHFGGRTRLSLLIAMAAALVHPIMALPGILLLLALRAPPKIGAAAAASVVVLSLLCALLARGLPVSGHLLAMMDRDWLEIVEARSPFLFLQCWSYGDWALNARPLMSLAITVAFSTEPRLRRMSAAALLVGTTGLALASIAGGVGPVALFVQGQAWRWIWVASFCAVIALVPVTVQMWKEGRNGSLCAALLAAGWLIPNEVGVFLLCGCALLWLLRDRLRELSIRHASWIMSLIAAIMVVTLAFRYWTVAEPPQFAGGRDSTFVTMIRHFMNITALPAALSVLLIYIIKRLQSRLALASLCLFLGAFLGWMLPSAARNVVHLGALVETKEFSDWQRIIPRNATVLMVPSPMSAAITWFMLDRPSYLSADQSSGVVFSRATAIEIRRRSAIMMPLWARNWGPEAATAPQPLTASSLIQVCADAAMDFVVSREDVGYGAVRHRSAGIWSGWNLYNCSDVNAAGPAS